MRVSFDLSAGCEGVDTAVETDGAIFEGKFRALVQYRGHFADDAVPVTRVERFSEALVTLLRDRRQRGQLADSARKRVEERLSLDAHVMAMQGAFEKCLRVYRGETNAP